MRTRIGDSVRALVEIGEKFPTAEGDRYVLHARPGDLGQVVFVEEGIVTITWESSGTTSGCIFEEFQAVPAEERCAAIREAMRRRPPVAEPLRLTLTVGEVRYQEPITEGKKYEH